VIETDASDYALAAILSQVKSDGEIHPVTYLSQTFSDTKLDYDTDDKELMAIYEAFKAWQHYLEGTEVPIDVVMDHKNLEYFCTTWILSRRQAQWSTFLSRFNMVIRFRPGCLRTKPNALTHRPDLYPKGEGKPYGTVNPQNCCPVFSSTQLSTSLQATVMLLVALHGIITMNIEELQKDILAAYDTYPAVQSFHADSDNFKYLHWFVDDVWNLSRLINEFLFQSPEIFSSVSFRDFMIIQFPDILVSTKLFQSFDRSILGPISESL
jgi:RNase H-like domain found in reverse transcriptase